MTIGTLNEKPLHAALKEWCARPDDRFEVAVDGYVIDIVRGDRLIEIQTRSFAALKAKLARLVETHAVHLVYPVAAEKWIVRVDDDGAALGRRKSRLRGSFMQVAHELVSFPRLLADPNFTLEVALIREEEVRRRDPARARNWRRRGWATVERRLLEVVDSRVLRTPADLAALLPAELAEPFTAHDLAAATGQPLRLSQQLIYCLRETGVLAEVGKRGRSRLLARADA
ncbi:MAG: hypothetical protein BWY52_02119 [Chloroflexi bacterium ADurb.Bin325]|nr:MAG: hypothetical protein BWY52_02119 [Chloroflexi bacterium ADurb.Bin325]